MIAALFRGIAALVQSDMSEKPSKIEYNYKNIRQAFGNGRALAVTQS